uniref:RuBisCO chaperone RbcX n=2 Tax=uncultured Stigonema sp. TaxID=1313254 RepID=A0A1D8GZT1_9CYAN|nr:RbcX [uncultured Stigonema sp.]AOT85754.1 RbcX [uncultured Stigonema sp.]
MDLKQVAKDTTKVLTSYLTYQAVRIVVAQLSETNPIQAMWLNGFSSTGKIQDGEAYIQELLQANQELALRIMTVREHLATEVTGFLPEMAVAAIAQSNMEHRRQHLERITRLHLPDPETDSASMPEALPENSTDSESN